ncbi:hypothetical protein QL285_016200 [Trifolium repens]|nr:hypothetical protein QL285_016200 [Trifolium repens]
MHQLKNAIQKVKKRRRRLAISDSSTARSLSHWEHMDRQFPNSQGSQSKPSRPKRKTARIGHSSPVPTPGKRIRDIRYMPRFMYPYIEDIIDVAPDSHCGYGASETFFLVRGRPSSDPSSNIMCVGLLPNHFVEVKLKPGCPIPLTSKEWKLYRAPKAESWEDAFLDLMAEFPELIENEMSLFMHLIPVVHAPQISFRILQKNKSN